MNRDLKKFFVNEKISKPSTKNYPTFKTTNHYIDEIWSNFLAKILDNKVSNNKGFIFTINKLDNFSKYTWCVPLKQKNAHTVTKEYSNILTSSKRSLGKNISDRGAEFYKSFFQKVLKIYKYESLTKIIRQKS